MATLCLEICLIRYFSISQHYHFAFLVVSIAFLGYGASGSFLTILKKFFQYDRGKFLSTASILFSVSLVLCFLLSNMIAFDFAKLVWDESQIWLILLYYILLSIPFLFAGLILSYAVTTAASSINKVYFADLFGAGSGTLLALVIFFPQGDRGVIVIISTLALLAAGLFQWRSSWHFRILFSALLIGLLALLFFPQSWMSFRISAFKALPVALKYPNAQHQATFWNSISRVDIIQSPAVRFAPGLSLLYSDPLPPQIGITIDGDNLTAVTKLEDTPNASYKFISSLPSSFAYTLYSEPNVLILEPKGGLDVLASQIFRARSVKVVENNPLIVKILHNQLADFTGDLYFKENILIENVHSRFVLQGGDKKFDLIIFPLEDVFGSSSTGLFGFGEDYLYTVEAFTEALTSLTTQGMVSMSFYQLPPTRKELRALTTWVEALERLGKNAASNICVLRSWGTISLFIKRKPFAPAEIQSLKTFARSNLFDLVHYPEIQREEANVFNRFEEPIYFDLFSRVLSPETRKRFLEDYLFHIEPVTDNRPFFHNFFKFNRLNQTFQSLGKKWLPFLQGEFVIPLLFLQSVLVATFFIFVPFLFPSIRRKNSRTFPVRVFFYFGLIGMAYIFFEITLIQKFILFLGNPLYSASIVISALLVSSGLGSLGSKKILGNSLHKNLKRILLLCGGLILFYLWILPIFFQIALKYALPIKMIVAVFIIFPVGFFMGIPFPAGIRILNASDKSLLPWAWATNAFSSVVNSISALLIAFWGGYSLVLILSCGGYLLTLPFLNFPSHQDSR